VIGCVVGFSVLGAPGAALALTESWDPVTGTESVSYLSSDSIPEGLGPVLSVDGSADRACEYCAAHSDVKRIVITSAKSAYVGITNGKYLIRSTGNVSVAVSMVAGATVYELDAEDYPQPSSVNGSTSYSLVATSDGFDFNGDGLSDFTLHAPSISGLATGNANVPSHIDLHLWAIPITNVHSPNRTPKTTIVGSKFDDLLIGTPYRDTIEGGGGNDKISGMAGNDDLNCWPWQRLGLWRYWHLGSGNDGFTSNRSSAAVWGDAGKDDITFCGCYHRTKRDRAYGGAGSDWLLGFVPRIHKSFERINFQH